MRWLLGIILAFLASCASAVPLQWITFQRGLPSHTTVLALAVNPRNQRQVFAGTYGAPGAWISDDGARAWQAFADGLGTLPVLALHFADDRLFAGTTAGLYRLGGNRWTRVKDIPPAAIYSISQLSSGPIYISTDAHGVFTSVDGGRTWTHIPGLDGEILLSVAALSSQTLIAGTAGHGAFFTSQGGAAWQPIDSFRGEYVSLVTVDPRDGRTVYLRTRVELFRSRDGARTWQLIHENDTIDALLILGNRLYAATRGHGVLASDDDGASWRGLSNGLPDGPAMLTLAPLDAQTILAGAQDGVYITHDAAGNWQRSSEGLAAPQVHALVIDQASGGLFAATEGGLYRSDPGPGGAFQRLGGDALAMPVLSIAVRNHDSHVMYAGTYRHGIFTSQDAGRSWEPVGDVFAERLSVPGILMDDSDEKTVWARVLFERIYKSSDGGESWHTVWSGMPEEVQVETMLLASGDLAHMYAGTSNGLYFSSNAGETWEPRGLESLAVFALWADPRDARVLLAGATDGLHLTTDAGATWRAGGLEDITVTTIVGGATGALFTGTRYNGVWTRGDNTANWTQLGTGLDHVSVESLAWDDVRRVLYAATNQGIFKIGPLAVEH